MQISYTRMKTPVIIPRSHCPRIAKVGDPRVAKKTSVILHHRIRQGGVLHYPQERINWRSGSRLKDVACFESNDRRHFGMTPTNTHNTMFAWHHHQGLWGKDILDLCIAGQSEVGIQECFGKVDGIMWDVNEESISP